MVQLPQTYAATQAALGAASSAATATLYAACRSLLRAKRVPVMLEIVRDALLELGHGAAVRLYLAEQSGIAQRFVRYDDAADSVQLDAAVYARLAVEGLVVHAPVPEGNAQTALLGFVWNGRLLAVALLSWPGAVPAEWQRAARVLAEDASQALAPLLGDRASGALCEGELLEVVSSVADSGLLYSTALERMLGAALTQVVAALRLVGGAIYLFDEAEERLTLAICTGGSAAEIGDVTPLWGEPVAAHSQAHAMNALTTQRTALLEADEAEDEREPALAGALRALGAKQLASVPLLAGSWATGVLQVVAGPERELGEQQLRLLSVVARQVAAAVENSRLFAQSRAEQERTRAVVDATNDAIVMLDEHRRPLLVNRRARFFFGFTERDLAGRSFDEIGSLFTRMFEDSQRFRSWLTQLLGSQTERAVEEFRILSPEPRLLQCYSAPVTDLHERYLGRLLVFRDITREREVERMKNDFVSTVSHELRTPLASIQGALQLVLGPPGGGGGMALGMAERGRELLSISLSNTERLIRMINDILDIAKIEQGRVELRREALNPAELCRAAAAEMSAFADAREITLEVQAAPWLPRVLADRDRAVQILVNLLSNAVKFSPPGQRVLLRARSEGQLVCFTVQDWGRGVASEHQPQLFQKFQQLDSSATRTVGGTGLGLAISKALVEEQGGRIWLESQPGEGSSFSFTLPLAPPGALGGPEARPLLALFEPNAELRAKLGAALRAEGWDVRELTTPDALDEADAPPVAMALVGPSLAATDPTIVGQLRAAGMLAPLLLLGTASGEAARGVAWMPWPAPVAEVAARALRLRAEHEPYVLVVDDDPYVRPVLVRLLQRHALRVASASDGFSALSMVEQQLPDVILLDIQMPGLSGFEVLRRLKAQERTAQIPVIILTANDLSEPARAQGHALGASAYLEKPVAYERLVSAVWVALGRPEDGS